MQTLLSDLNNKQKEAVTCTKGPLLILAGAGSGKTRVLTYRIAHILEQKLAYPEQILAVTFTNKAAGEMKTRVAKLTKGAKVPWIGTFHSICVRILRRDGHNIGIQSNFAIFDETDQLSSVKEVMKNLSIDTKSVNPKAVLSYISSAKNELIEADVYRTYAKGYFEEYVATIYPYYQSFLKKNNALDFDDILLLTVKLFRLCPQILDKYQTLFKYIHIDEYQDTNNAQYTFVKLHADRYKNICVVGDDDQSIYSWRGANIKNILSFEKDYPQAKIIKLEQNYRSTKTILGASNSVIKVNSERKKKKLWTENPDGELISIYEAANEKDEANFVAEKIKGLVSTTSPNDIVVLYRINAQSRIIEESLLKSAIPYKIIGNVRFYDRKEIKDVISYLKIIHNKSDDISLKRIINSPPRGIGIKTVENIEEKASEAKLSIIEYLIQNKAILKQNLKEFAENFIQIEDASTKLRVQELISFIIEKSGYLKWLESEKDINLGRIENIKELATLANEFNILSPQESLEAFLERVSLYESQDELDKDEEEKVTLMTIHAAKGLEFKYVFIVGLEEGLFPHSRSYASATEMEEERRLAYVAITRAKEKLFLIHARVRSLFGSFQENIRSRFIDDIPENVIDTLTIGSNENDGWEEVTDKLENEFERKRNKNQTILTKGLKVRHNVFGIGTVIDFDESCVIINFNGIGKKELLLEYAQLEKV